MNLQTFENDLNHAIKQRNQTVVNTLRGLKSRVENEKRNNQDQFGEAQFEQIVSSEVKRRKEAVEAYTKGGRPELAEQESAEIEVLSAYLPKQLSSGEISEVVKDSIQQNNWTASDFGLAMKTLKEKLGNTADGQVLAQTLKQNLSS